MSDSVSYSEKHEKKTTNTDDVGRTTDQKCITLGNTSKGHLNAKIELLEKNGV
jgi:hypothetical protein